MDGITTTQITEFLSSTKLFGHFENALLKKIALFLRTIHLKGGEVLIHQNEPGHSLYIVFSGRLRAIVTNREGEEISQAEIGHGEIVGEIALILGEPRTATVRGIRDSILLEFTKEDYEQISKQYPELPLIISRFCVKRLISAKPVTHSRFETIVFIPAGNNPNFSEFVFQVAHSLESVGSTLYLNQNRFNELYGEDAAQVPFESSKNAKIVSWLHEQETKYRYIIYETDHTLTQWTLRCLRQADRIILVGAFDENDDINEIERELLITKEKTSAITDLVLLHKTSARPVNTARWLENRLINDCYHIQVHSSKDYARFIRLLTGKSLGLVLAGGGIRCSAFIGLFRALQELKINIDIIGANSAGSLLAGCFALGMDYKEIKALMEEMQRGFKYNYTYPMVSLFSGKYLTNYMHRCLGDVAIEDLWMKFFCVSCNLSKTSLHIHNRGPLWEAVRTSSSIPALLPPVINKEGELFVDGGVYNNFPVDIMRKRIQNGKILGVNLLSYEHAKYDQIGFSVSGWKLLFQNMFLPKQRKRLPSIAETILMSMTAASDRQEAESVKLADYLITLNVSNFQLFQTKGLNDLVNHAYIYYLQELERIFNP